MNGHIANEPVRTTCPYCGVGCGVLAEQNVAGQWSVRGDPDHPANFGRLCSKGAALAETIDLPQRLTVPMQRMADGGFSAFPGITHWIGSPKVFAQPSMNSARIRSGFTSPDKS